MSQTALYRSELFLSALIFPCFLLMEPHLLHFVHPWGPRYKKDGDLLEYEHRERLEHLSWDDRLRELGWRREGTRETL